MSKAILVQNIYYMLSYAYQNLQQKNYEEIATENFENTQDLFAAVLEKGVAVQLKRGLNREYVEQSEDLSILRGKIDIKKSIQQKVQKRRRLSCCFDEFSENYLMNQILKTTMLQLIYSNDVKRKIKDKLKRLLLYFSGVDILDPLEINWNTLHYNRNNTTYRMLMNICYLVLKGLLLTTKQGKRKLATFLDDQQMSRLYEKFLLEYYKKHFPQYHPASKQISWNADGSTSFLPVMQSDIMLSDGNKKLIVDAKYYTRTMQTQFEAAKIRSSHLYQIFAYVKNEDKHSTGKVSGMLLYAKTDEELVPNINYILGGNNISVKVLDLNVSFNLIQQQLDQVVNIWNQLY